MDVPGGGGFAGEHRPADPPHGVGGQQESTGGLVQQHRHQFPFGRGAAAWHDVEVAEPVEDGVLGVGCQSGAADPALHPQRDLRVLPGQRFP